MASAWLHATFISRACRPAWSLQRSQAVFISVLRATKGHSSVYICRISIVIHVPALHGDAVCHNNYTFILTPRCMGHASTGVLHGPFATIDAHAPRNHDTQHQHLFVLLPL